MEESKDQEISKLQQSLQEMQKRIDETIDKLAKDHVAAQKASQEVAFVVKETPVTAEDAEKNGALMAEIEALKVFFHHI